VYFITIRRTDVEKFSDATYNESLIWFTFILASLFFAYIMLNLTVSMVKLFYD